MHIKYGTITHSVKKTRQQKELKEQGGVGKTGIEGGQEGVGRGMEW